MKTIFITAQIEDENQINAITSLITSLKIKYWINNSTNIDLLSDPPITFQSKEELSPYLMSEQSLSEHWLSDEDNQWDKF